MEQSETLNAGSLHSVVGHHVEGPKLWLARRNGICKGYPHRIEYRAEFYRINGKPYCTRCARKKITDAVMSNGEFRRTDPPLKP